MNQCTTIEVQQILSNFDLLPEADKREPASEILRRSISLESTPLSDEGLTTAAEEVILEPRWRRGVEWLTRDGEWCR